MWESSLGGALASFNWPCLERTQAVAKRCGNNQRAPKAPNRAYLCSTRLRLCIPPDRDAVRSGHSGAGAHQRSAGGFAGMFQEEPQHLPPGIGPVWIGIRPSRIAARPRVAGAVDYPRLEHDLTIPFGV